MKGKLIVFEGGEGSGKSTMVNKTYFEVIIYDYEEGKYNRK